MLEKDILDEIAQINLAYLQLTQRMVCEDKIAAASLLAIETEIGELLTTLTTGQLTRLASTNTLLCRFRMNDHVLLSALVKASATAETRNSIAARESAALPA